VANRENKSKENPDNEASAQWGSKGDANCQSGPQPEGQELPFGDGKQGPGPNAKTSEKMKGIFVKARGNSACAFLLRGQLRPASSKKNVAEAYASPEPLIRSN